MKKVIVLTIVGFSLFTGGSIAIVLYFANFVVVSSTIAFISLLVAISGVVVLYRIGRKDIYTTKFEVSVQKTGSELNVTTEEKNKRVAEEYKKTLAAKENLKDLKDQKVPEKTNLS